MRLCARSPNGIAACHASTAPRASKEGPRSGHLILLRGLRESCPAGAHRTDAVYRRGAGHADRRQWRADWLREHARASSPGATSAARSPPSLRRRPQGLSGLLRAAVEPGSELDDERRDRLTEMISYVPGRALGLYNAAYRNLAADNRAGKA